MPKKHSLLAIPKVVNIKVCVLSTRRPSCVNALGAFCMPIVFIFLCLQCTGVYKKLGLQDDSKVGP